MNINTRIKLNNGTAIPVLGLGMWDAREETGIQAVEWALRAGYRLVDTAAFYGNEREVGEGIRRSGVPRQEVFVTTKLWNTDQLNGTQREAFDKSLDALGLDYVDLYLLHWPVPGKYKESWAILEDIYRSGRAKAIGVSNFHQSHLADLATTAEVTPAVNQIELHPRLAQRELAACCEAMGIAVEAYKPLGGRSGNLRDNPELTAIGARHGKSPAQVMLRWCLQRGIVAIPKSANEGRIKENADIFDFALAEPDMAAIDALNTDTRFGEDPDRITEYPKLMGG